MRSIDRHFPLCIEQLEVWVSPFAALINDIFCCPSIILGEVTEVLWFKDKSLLVTAHVV